MRIAVGRFYTETCSFSPLLANREMFQAGALKEGEDMLSFFRDTRTEVLGFLRVLSDAGVEPVPLVGAQAACAGPLEEDFWKWLYDRFVTTLKAAGPIDGVLLSLHGSISSEKEEDLCGALLATVRHQVGPHVPIVATLDLHANTTMLMSASADALVAYKTYPHHDFVERGQQAAEILLAAAKGKVHPAMGVTTIPMRLLSLDLLNELIQKAIELEQQPGVLCCSIVPGCSYLDVREYKYLSAIVVTDGDTEKARRLGAQLMWEAWSQRERSVTQGPRLVPLPEAIHEALAFPPGTVVMADRMDAVSAGFPGDSVEILRHLLALRMRGPACMVVNDPEYVRIAVGAGVNSVINAPLGGKWGGSRYGPIQVEARVRILSDGTLMKSREPRPGHLAVTNTSMGLTAVVQIQNSMTAVVTSVPVMSTEPTVYRSVGIEPSEYRVVVAKSMAQQRFHYAFAAGFIDIDAPGWGQSPQWKRRPSTPFYPANDIPDAEILNLLGLKK